MAFDRKWCVGHASGHAFCEGRRQVVERVDGRERTNAFRVVAKVESGSEADLEHLPAGVLQGFDTVFVQSLHRSVEDAWENSVFVPTVQAQRSLDLRIKVGLRFTMIAHFCTFVLVKLQRVARVLPVRACGRL